MHTTTHAADTHTSFKRAQFTLGPTREHHFEIAVPAPCLAVPLPATPPRPQLASPFVPLARFEAPVPDRLSLEVSLASLSRDVNAGDFGELDAKARGMDIVQRQDADPWLGHHSQLIAHDSGPHGPRVHRIRLLKDGSSLFRVALSSPADTYDHHARAIAQSTMSFRLLEPTGRESAESLVNHITPGPVPWAFVAPAWWSRALPTDMPASTRLAPDSDAPFALWIEVASTDPAVEPHLHLRAFAATLRSRGLTLDGAPICAATPPPGFDEMRFYSPPARHAGRDHHVTAIALRQGDRAVLCAACGPARHAAAWGWALTKHAGQTIVRTLSPA